MKPAWKRMATGHYINLNNLRPEDIRIKDIEVSLNETVRFNGHHKDRKPLTVAQHSLLCLNIAKILFPGDDGILRPVFSHDFAEAYIGDVATPVKQALGKGWYDWADPIEHIVDMSFNVQRWPEREAMVKICDLTALDIERRAMWNSQLGKEKWPVGHIDIGQMQDKLSLFEEVQSQGYINIEEIWNELPT